MKAEKYYVYIIECADGSLYTGVTTDVERRFGEHLRGLGSAYTRSKGVKKVLYQEGCLDRSSAQRREAEIKSWSRQRKLLFVKNTNSTDS